MQTIRVSYPHKAALQGAGSANVMAIGEFDGVHLGHASVIKKAQECAAESEAITSLMTFDPHPRQVLGHDQYAKLLTPLSSKLQLFEEQGIDFTYVIDFNTYLMKMSPECFVEEVLIPLQLHTVVVGFDFRFGHRGEGHADMLRQLSKGRFHVEIVLPLHMNGTKISSTAIREALQAGDVDRAKAFLGRWYAIRGEVVTGDARGRTIGFPTANIMPSDAYLIPANGVYAVKATIQGKDHAYSGVMNIGVKPTFHSGVQVPTLEAHLFDFDEMIYGATMEVELVAYLRKERKFSSIQELIHQIQQDAAQAKRY
jgi:riboflavin kinase / FMN adenylyltransferase